MKETIRIARLKDRVVYISSEEIRYATISDMRKVGYSWDDCGCKKIADDTNDDESLWSVYGAEKELTFDEMMAFETNLEAISYWDGNNWQTRIFEEGQIGYEEVIEINKLPAPNPPYYYEYEIIRDGEKEIVYKSNMSGSLTPYYIGNKE